MFSSFQSKFTVYVFAWTHLVFFLEPSSTQITPPNATPADGGGSACVVLPAFLFIKLAYDLVLGNWRRRHSNRNFLNNGTTTTIINIWGRTIWSMKERMSVLWIKVYWDNNKWYRDRLRNNDNANFSSAAAHKTKSNDMIWKLNPVNVWITQSSETNIQQCWHGFYIRVAHFTLCAYEVKWDFSEKKIRINDSFDVNPYAFNKSKCLVYSICVHFVQSYYLM